MDLFGKKRTSEELERLNKEAEERDAQRRAVKENLLYINLNSTPVNLDALKIILEEQAKETEVAVVDSKHQELVVAVYNFQNPKTQDLINELKTRGFQVSLFISSQSGLKKAWERYKEIKAAPEKGALSGVEIGAVETFKNLTFERVSPKIQELETGEGGVLITDLLDFVLGSAIQLGASDIHIEPEKSAALLRFRIDGLLYDVYRLNLKTYSSILNRLKLLSGLKINITNIPQDGRFTTKFDKDYIEIRTSIIPAEYGETVVLRVLDPHTISLSLSDLGLRKDDEEVVKLELRKPNGIILVTGPTGSGKTTTLYAFLKAVRSSELKVITIEDPIEYHLEGIEQTQINPKSGYTFGGSLKSVLRQDPDVILIGEIRDLETAEVGMHAALTGHLVFSTLHTNDASGAIPRLVDLGVKTSIIGPALNIVIAQRLVRKLCHSCKIVAEINTSMTLNIKKFLKGLPPKINNIYENKEITFYKAVGCAKCRGGFKGRLGVFELLKCGDELETLITKEATNEVIKRLARQQGMVKIQVDGILKAFDGVTTLEEVERVTGSIEW